MECYVIKKYTGLPSFVDLLSLRAEAEGGEGRRRNTCGGGRAGVGAPTSMSTARQLLPGRPVK